MSFFLFLLFPIFSTYPTPRFSQKNLLFPKISHPGQARLSHHWTRQLRCVQCFSRHTCDYVYYYQLVFTSPLVINQVERGCCIVPVLSFLHLYGSIIFLFQTTTNNALSEKQLSCADFALAYESSSIFHISVKLSVHYRLPPQLTNDSVKLKTTQQR